jgi:serine/threonine protein kinase
MEKISDFILSKDIGEGYFGKVKLGIFKPTNEKYAIKIINKKLMKIKMKKSKFKEIDITKKFNHINVIYVYKVIDTPENYYIVMEYCKNGELFEYISKKERLDEDEASSFFYQIINGVEYIHSKGIAHRDLKLENLLLTEDNIIKIIDFGLSHEFNGKDLLKTKCGSPSYASPELIAQPFYDGFKSDIWCCGIILYAMLCGYLPFDGDEDKDGKDVLFKNIIEGNLEFPKFISDLAKDLIIRLLNVDAKERISIPEIKKHPFYLKGKKECKISSAEKKIEEKSNQNNFKENIAIDAINNSKFIKDNINDNKYVKKNSHKFHNLSPNYNKNINIITNDHGLYREQINYRNNQILNTEGNTFINPLSMFNASKKNNLIYKLFDTKLSKDILEKSKKNHNNFLSIENPENKTLKPLIKKNLTDKNNSLYYKVFGNSRKYKQSNTLDFLFDKKFQYSNDSRTFGDEVFLRNFRKTLLNKEKIKREKNVNKSNDKYKMKLKVNRFDNIDNFEKRNITLSTENKIKRKNLCLNDKEIYINHIDIIPNNMFSINSEIKIPNTRYNNGREKNYNTEHIFINDNNAFVSKSNSINVNNKNYASSLDKYGIFKSENNENRIENLNKIVKIGNQNKINSNSIIKQKTKNFLNKLNTNYKTIEPYNLNKRNNTIENNKMPINLSKKIKDYSLDNNGYKLKVINDSLINQLFSNNKRKKNNININGENKNILPILTEKH